MKKKIIGIVEAKCFGNERIFEREDTGQEILLKDIEMLKYFPINVKRDDYSKSLYSVYDKIPEEANAILISGTGNSDATGTYYPASYCKLTEREDTGERKIKYNSKE